MAATHAGSVAGLRPIPKLHDGREVRRAIVAVPDLGGEEIGQAFADVPWGATEERQECLRHGQSAYPLRQTIQPPKQDQKTNRDALAALKPEPTP